MGAFSSRDEQGLLFVVVHGLHTAVAFLSVELRLQTCGPRSFSICSLGCVVVAHKLSSCSTWVPESHLVGFRVWAQ